MPLFILLLLCFLSPPSLTASLNQDGLFLLRAKLALSDPDNFLSTWNPADATPCRWFGITCHPHSGEVTAVNLSSTGISGNFPSTLCRLPYLSSLNLSNNLLNSTLPTAVLPACRRLVNLDLSENNFIGSIPDTISEILTLRHLDLSFNNFSGDIPASLSKLPQLESLVLLNNLLNGTIPNSLGNISTLKVLHLAYNPFRPSQIPSQLGNLTHLEELWFAGCNLLGPIPESFGELVSLKNLDLSSNRLTGKIPESLTWLQSLNQLELFSNSLSGELPLRMSNMTRLEKFDASLNELTGTIPSELCELPLASLNLYSNRLEGSLPESIACSPNLYELKLFRNKLVGTLPSDLGKNSPFVKIDVSYNHFSGEIPASLCWHGKLEELIMINNSFSGNIPETLGNCKSLRRVRLKINKLSGSVPDGIWGLPRLFLFELMDNSLSGHISNAISGAYNLSILLLSKNQFSGSIPEEIGLVNSLLKFSADHNNLSGQISSSMFKLSELSSLDLSYNQISGELSGRIDQWNKLNDLNLANNMFYGNIPSELGSLAELNSLDLSGNKFFGEIPLQLQNLKLSELNLSNNQLSGKIPPLYANEKYRASFLGNPGLYGGFSGYFSGLCTRKSKQNMWIFWSIFVLAGVLLIVGVTWFVLKYKNMKKLKKGFHISKWMSFHKLGFREFEVVKCLSEDNVIGSGASGKVYKVVLSNGQVVAVKKLWGASKKFSENIICPVKDQFDVEVETLGKIRHKNIVRLWCCCNSGDDKLLVYEYMSNGSLADMLKCGKKRSSLDWPTRYRIAIDAAEGLSYLHHDCVPPIVHRDVKSNNILLDGEFVAKVADFGVAKMIGGVSQEGEPMSVIAGSYGYIAPEYAYTIQVNEKSDIYSFGIVILELVTGKPPIDAEYGDNDLVKWVTSTLKQKGLDHVIDPILDFKHMEEISKVLSVGLHCTNTLPFTRPSMRCVVKMLHEVTMVSKFKSPKVGILSCEHEGASSNQESIA